MLKKILSLFLILIVMQSAYAYEDCVIFNKYKLTDINIEDNSVINVIPVITVGNEKNTLIVHPLKAGETRFCVLKNNKNLALFEVTVTDYGTSVNSPEGFEVLSLDNPNEEPEFELDEPPIYLK